ncbi:2-keto-4-pentenoate hydratase [Marinomonas gallaica]|uniref:2-keto-4-pentenoate hydratase n=1 Tax=Marinomonas gallaica TaxID=1806667 RepID=UPI003CE57ECE
MKEHAVAKRLIKARREAVAVPLTDDVSNESIDFSYQVQKAVITLNEQDQNGLTGWKVALSSKPALTRFSLQEPIYAPLFHSNALTGVLSKDRVIAPKIESEIAFILGADLTDSHVSDEQIIAAIKWMVPAIEVADCRFQNWKFDINHFVADGAAAGFYQLGNCVSFDPKAFDSSDFSCQLVSDDRCETGSLSNVLDGPLGSMLRLVRGVLDTFGSVKADQVFLSGSLTTPMDMVVDTTYRLHLLGQTTELIYR